MEVEAALFCFAEAVCANLDRAKQPSLASEGAAPTFTLHDRCRCRACESSRITLGSRILVLSSFLRFSLTSKMSHDHGGRGSCWLRLRSRCVHSIWRTLAGDVTDVGVGSGALLGERRDEAISGMNSVFFPGK